MLELSCGRLVGSWITGTERKHFHIFFPIYSSITIGMGVIFLIANRGNKQINKPLRYERYMVTSHFEHRTRCYAKIKLQITVFKLQPQGYLRGKVFRA